MARADFLMADGKPEGVAFDAHLAAAHRVASDFAGIACDACLAGEAEVVFEMLLGIGCRREQIHARGDFDDAFLALAVLLARRRNGHAQRFGLFEERAAPVRPACSAR